MMTPQQVLAPFFDRVENRLIPGMPFADYQHLPGFNASLLKEETTYEAMEKLMATSVLPLDLQRLLEMTGGDVSDAIEYAESCQRRTVPRPYLEFVAMPGSGLKVSSAQQKVVDFVYDANDAVSMEDIIEKCRTTQATIHKCVVAGWIKVTHREVVVETVTENVKASRALALTTGEAVHAAILQPEMFDVDTWQDYWQISPTTSLTSVAAMEAQASDPRKLITSDIIAVARRCRDAVYKHDEAAHLLRLPGKSECSAVAWDSRHECMRKCRFDRLPDSRDVVVDIKTTRLKLKASLIAKEIVSRGYDIQASYYLDTLNMVEGGQPRPCFKMIFVRNSAPFIARVFEVNTGGEKCYMEAARQLYVERLAGLCVAWLTNKFEAYEHESPCPILRRS